MFKKFIAITSVSIIAALSSNPVFAETKAEQIVDSPAYSAFFKNYDNYISGQKEIVKDNSISINNDGTIIYSFAQGDKLNIDADVLTTDKLTDGHKGFVQTIADYYNDAFAKGYYQTQAQVNLRLSDNSTYTFYSASEIKKQFEEQKQIVAHNDIIQERISALDKQASAFHDKIADLYDDAYDEALASPEYSAIVKNIEAETSMLIPSKRHLGARAFLDIQKNTSLLDATINPSQIFVLGNPGAVEHKNYMLSKADAKKGLEQCSTVLSVDKNGDQVSLLPSDLDKSGMMFANLEEKKLFYKFVLLHELAHCDFGTNETTNFKKYSLGNPEVDKVVNDLFNPANATRYLNPLNRHFQEHYADVYTSMILLREESNTELVNSFLDKITTIRSIGSVHGDYEHLSTYSMEQLKHPDIVAKIKSMPVEKLSELAMEISQKGVALTLANSKDFQSYLNNTYTQSLNIIIIKAITHAIDGTDFKTSMYDNKGLGDKDSALSTYADQLLSKIKDEIKKDPDLKSELKVFLSSHVALINSDIQIPSSIMYFAYSEKHTILKNALFTSSSQVAAEYLKTNGDFHVLGDKLKASLIEKDFEPTSSIGVSSLIGKSTKDTDLSPSSLPYNINSFVLKTSLDKDVLKEKIEEVSKKALETRNQYLNGNNNIKVNKL